MDRHVQHVLLTWGLKPYSSRVSRPNFASAYSLEACCHSIGVFLLLQEGPCFTCWRKFPVLSQSFFLFLTFFTRETFCETFPLKTSLKIEEIYRTTGGIKSSSSRIKSSQKWKNWDDQRHQEIFFEKLKRNGIPWNVCSSLNNLESPVKPFHWSVLHFINSKYAPENQLLALSWSFQEIHRK